MAHGYDFDEAALPTAKVRTLLGELVRVTDAGRSLRPDVAHVLAEGSSALDP